MGIDLDGRVAIVTGGGRGIGREHALLMASRGAKVVVNDLGIGLDATGSDPAPAEQVVAEIEAAGGSAVADGSDVTDFAQAEALVERAISKFGRLDVLVNNAGIVRDRMLVNMTIEDFETALRVNLVGTFAPSRFAASYWRAESKAGNEVDARIVCTSSGSGLYANVGQSNYGAAKSGVATFAQIAAKELGRYGVTVNAIVPIANTRLTAGVDTEVVSEESPAHVAPLVCWLASRESAAVTGRIFNVAGGEISIVESWHTGPVREKAGMWEVDELSEVIPALVAAAPPAADLRGRIETSA
ncbi:MAG TPA: SDR family oxidoreductase [Solirubrobacterales bacterium]|jgi:NAD(P)-dependent dehydrogenase (short-subunit alcohol dehydrogenase family)|nr:SDR family oxidoreductase [Solirubrobacterales bacterium]